VIVAVRSRAPGWTPCRRVLPLGPVPGGGPGQTSHRDVRAGSCPRIGQLRDSNGLLGWGQGLPEQRGQLVEGGQVIAEKYRNLPDMAEPHGRLGSSAQNGARAAHENYLSASLYEERRRCAPNSTVFVMQLGIAQA